MAKSNYAVLVSVLFAVRTSLLGLESAVQIGETVAKVSISADAAILITLNDQGSLKIRVWDEISSNYGSSTELRTGVSDFYHEAMVADDYLTIVMPDKIDIFKRNLSNFELLISYAEAGFLKCYTSVGASYLFLIDATGYASFYYNNIGAGSLRSRGTMLEAKANSIASISDGNLAGIGGDDGVIRIYFPDYSATDFDIKPFAIMFTFNAIADTKI